MGNLKSTQALILLLLDLGTLHIYVACPYCSYPTPSKSQNLPPKYLQKVKPPVKKLPPTVPKPPPQVPKPLTDKPPHISKLTLYFSWGYHYAYPHVPPITQPPRIPRWIVHPPIRPELPIFATLPITPRTPIVYPPIIPTPPITLTPPVIKPPPPPLETPFCPPLPPLHVPKPPPNVPKPPIGHPPIHPKHPIVYPPITSKPPIVYPPVVPTPPITPTPSIITPPPLPPVVPQPPPETPCPPLPSQETPCPPPPPQLETCPIRKLDACVDELGSLMHVGIGSKAKDTCCPMLAGLLDLDAALCLCTTIKAKLLNINIVIPIAFQVLVNCGKTLPSGFQCPT